MSSLRCLGGGNPPGSHLPVPQPAPWLTFSSAQGKEEWTFYNVIDKSCEERLISSVSDTDLLMSSHGWCLLRDRGSEEIFVFNLISLETIHVPPINSHDNHTKFTYFFSLPPSDPDWSLVCIHRFDHYFLIFRPGDNEFTKHVFQFLEAQDISGVVSHGGKVFARTCYRDVVVIIDPFPDVRVEYLEIDMPKVPRLGRFSRTIRLVEACGDIFLVDQSDYLDSDILHHIEVARLDFSKKVWVRVDSIGDLIFFLGSDYSVACTASAANIKGNCIYIIDTIDKKLNRYDLEYGSLTVDYPIPPFERCPGDVPHWVLVNQGIDEQSGKNNHIKEDQHQEGSVVVSPLQSCVVNSGRDFTLSQQRAPGRGYPKNPWLMLTHKNNGIYKLVDPMSDEACTLSIPELSGSTLYFSREGWLIVHKTPQVMFLFNPFTNDKLELPLVRFSMPVFYGIAFSATPTSPDCMVFGIVDADEDAVNVCFYRCGDEEWTQLVFPNYHNFCAAHNNPVFHNGLFYCLGLEGSLGVFDPEKLTWTILSLCLDFDFDQVERYFLLESDGKLLAFFMDQFGYPHGQFRLDADGSRWEEVSDFGDRILFLGQSASFSIPAPDQDMENSICLPKFEGEYDYDDPIILGPRESGDSSSVIYYKHTEYLLNIWIELFSCHHIKVLHSWERVQF